jgi:tetratricopeptide (TPR) repeat protein
MRPLRGLLVATLLSLTACGGNEPPAGPPPGELDLASGQEAMRAGQYSVADDLFQRAYVRGADPAESLLWQARAEVALGLVENARATLVRLLDLKPTLVPARALQVRLDLLLGEYEDAYLHWTQLKHDAPSDPTTALTEVELLLGIGLGSRAERAITAARGTHPTLPEWAFHAAQADLLRGWVRAARGAYSAAATATETGLGHAREAWFAALLGETDRAERAYLDAAVHAGSDALPFSLSADFYAALGRFDEAVTDLANMERVLGRGSPDLTRRLSGLFVRSGHLTDAEGLLKPYLQRRVEDRTMARELALAYLLAGKDTEASATLEVLSLKDRESATTQFLVGAARLKAGDTTRARSAFQEAERLGGVQLPVELALAVAALRTHDWFDAEFQARRRLERVPDDWLAGVLWAAARKYAGQVPAARLLESRLVEHFPAHAQDIRALLGLPPVGPEGEIAPENLPPRLLDRFFPPKPAPPPPSAPASAP